MAWSMISTGLVVWIAFNCSNHINNWLVHGNPLYPLNIIHTEETGA
ncbi:MAG TPA: hypothetical protein PK765_03835 [bacterium]|nr:hypothetical protein [bacterium]